MRTILGRHRRTLVTWSLTLSIGGCTLLLTGCHFFDTQRLIFNERGVRVGIETDPSVHRASPLALNEHPANLTPQDIQTLLGAVRVSGWSGTVVGWFDQPRPIALFDEADLQTIAKPIADAVQQASPMERIVFSLSNPKSAYGDATTGALFLRHATLHLVVTDHKAFPRADTAGGEEKDLRDTKGMTLSLPRAYQAATLRRTDEPDWAPFERVHLSMQVKEMLAHAHRTVNGTGTPSEQAQAELKAQPPVVTEPTMASQELRLQIRELTQSNLDLRDRLNQQTEQLQALKEELTKLRRESEGTKSKRPPSRKPVAP